MFSRKQLISLYRAFLRELPPLRPASHIARSTLSATGLSSLPPAVRLPVHYHLRTTFSYTPTALKEEDDKIRNANFQQQVQSSQIPSYDQAVQLLEYLKAQRIYVELLERYNPMLRMEDKERIRLTARRVGLDLPIEFQEKDEKP